MADKTDNLIYDGISAFPGGMDSGELPRSLPPGKAAFLFNATVRGGFPTDRPKFRKIELTFDSASIQAAFETGLFQTGGYRRSQQGIGFVMTSIAGRIFQIEPDTASGGAVVERTIPGDPNLSTQPQAWGWQSELWWILTDGNGLPIFVDDNTARRSAGPSLNVGTIAGAGFIAPAIGSNVTVTLASNYTGPLNAVVSVDSGSHAGATYIVISVGAPGGGTGYEASLKNFNATPGTVLPIGTPIIVPTVSNVIGTVATAFTGPVNHQPFNVNVFTQQTSFLGATVGISGFNYAVLSIGATNPDGSKTLSLKVFDADPPPYKNPAPTIPAGTNVVNPFVSPQPGYTVGNLVVAFTVPAANTSASAFLDALYTGAANLSVQANGKNYRISPVAQAPPVPSTTVVLQNLTDGSTGESVAAGIILRTLGELGIGRMGAYGHGRNWMSLIDGVSFTASDLVGESSGSSAYNYRDAVLKVTKNAALTAGKPFRIPSSGDTIQGMAFPAQLDTSLGQGPLSVFTTTNVFSCQAPVNSATWATLTTPILPVSLVGSGGTGQWSIVCSSGDLFFRSPDGIRSQLIARLDFNKWGNTPISFEMERVISMDDQNLLNFCSTAVFENRLLMTCNPIQGQTGVYHRGLMVINFDELSSLQGKTPAVYDGLWSGLQILQLIQAPLNGFIGQTRQFALCFNSVDNKNELWEILPDGAAIEDQVSAEPVCNNVPSPPPNSPSTDNLTLWLDGGSNWTDPVWTDRIAAIPFNSNGLGFAQLTPPNLLNFGTLGTDRAYTGTVTNPSVIFLQYSFLSPLNTGIILSAGGVGTFKIEFITAGGTIKVTTSAVNSVSVSGLTHRPAEYIIQVTTTAIGGTVLTVYNAATLAIVGTASMVSGVDLTGSLTVALGSSANGASFAMFTRGLLTYSALPTGESFTDTLNYLSGLLFGRFNTPIVCAPDSVRTIWAFESPDLFRGKNGELITQFKALEAGEVSVDDVKGDVDIQVFYKPDQYPGWILWHKWSISVDMSAPDAQPGYFPRMGLGRPKSTDDNAVTGQLSRFGYTFRTRTVIQGHCRPLGSKYGASPQPEPKINTPIDGTKHVAIAVPRLDDFSLFNLNAGITTLPR